MRSSSVFVEWSELFVKPLDDDLIDLWAAVESAHGVPAAAVSSTAQTFIASQPDRAFRIVDVVSEVDAVHDVDVGATIMALTQNQTLDEWAPSIRHNVERVALLRDLADQGVRVGIVTESVWSRSWITQFLDRDHVPYSAVLIANEGNWRLDHPAAWEDGIARLGPGVAICQDQRKAAGALASGLVVKNWCWVPHELNRQTS